MGRGYYVFDRRWDRSIRTKLHGRKTLEFTDVKQVSSFCAL